MATFRDEEGRSWDLVVTAAEFRRCRRALALNLAECVAGELMQRLDGDPALLVDVIYVCCQPQAEQRQVSDEAFGRALAGESYYAAKLAFWEALADFFPRESPERGVLAGRLRVHREILAEGMRQAATAIEAIDVAEVLAGHGLPPTSSTPGSSGSPAGRASTRKTGRSPSSSRPPKGGGTTPPGSVPASTTPPDPMSR